MTYGVIAVKGVAVYAANDGWSNILGVGDTEYVERLSFQRQHSPIFISGGFAECARQYRPTPVQRSQAVSVVVRLSHNHH